MNREPYVEIIWLVWSRENIGMSEELRYFARFHRPFDNINLHCIENGLEIING